MSAPLLVRTRAELADALAATPGRRAVVMTMGALHDGHLSLVAAARGLADHVVVTIFVNPLQFGAGEDLDRYPRDLDRDVALLSGAGADLVFAPDVADVYPEQPVVTVSAGRIGERLEGAHRPGHFDGVLTVAASERRSQLRNREAALERLVVLVEDALRERAPRHPTRPSRASRTRRTAAERQRREVKAMRRPPRRSGPE